MIVQGISVADFRNAVERAGEVYGDNLAALIGTEHSKTRFNARVVLKDTGFRLYGRGDDLAPGQRRSWSGRRGAAACWHAYRDVLIKVFNVNPDARVYTAMASYKGRKGFNENYPATGWRNVGSMAQPTTMPELCDCPPSSHCDY